MEHVDADHAVTFVPAMAAVRRTVGRRPLSPTD